VVSSTDAACSLVPWDRLCEEAETCAEAPRERVGARAHLADHLGQLLDHGHEGLAEGVVVRARRDARAQVAAGEVLREPAISCR
jgi:hypothetical protein